MKGKKVFVVIFDWAVQDDAAVEVEVFADPKEAKDYFDQKVAGELNPDVSWVADAVKQEGDEIVSAYEDITVSDARNKNTINQKFSVYSDDGRYSDISLTEKEVK